MARYVASASGGGGSQSNLDAKNYGARGTDLIAAGHNSNDPFLALAQEMFNSRRSPGGQAGITKVGSKTIHLPPGDYRITELRGLLGRENPTEKVEGLRIIGAGSSLVNVFFNPATDGPLLFNDYWLNIHIEGVRFWAERTGCTFMQSHTTNNAQKYTFTDVVWRGPWKYVFDLQGNDNNSEYIFIGCETHFLDATGAFLHIGATNTSDEFLNYWFYGFKHWSTSAPLIDSSRGGHFHIWGLDVSAWGADLTAPGYLFYLRSTALKSGTHHFTCAGVRGELHSANAGFMHCAWPEGVVDIQADVSSQWVNYTYGSMFDLLFVDREGPVFHVHDSSMAGGIRITYNKVSAGRSPRLITVSDTEWKQRRSPSEVVTYVRPADADPRHADPVVNFLRCRSHGNYQDAFLTESAVTWDATVGYDKGDRVTPLVKRQLRVKDFSHTLNNDAVTYVGLPVGALVTGIRVLAPAGLVSSTDFGTWTVATTEATPTTVLTYTATRTQAQGYNLAYELPAPYRCTSTTTATLRITTTNISKATETTPEMVFILEGYW